MFSLTKRVITRGGPELFQQTVLSHWEEHDVHNNRLVLSIVHTHMHNNNYKTHWRTNRNSNQSAN